MATPSPSRLPRRLRSKSPPDVIARNDGSPPSFLPSPSHLGPEFAPASLRFGRVLLKPLLSPPAQRSALYHRPRGAPRQSPFARWLPASSVLTRRASYPTWDAAPLSPRWRHPAPPHSQDRPQQPSLQLCLYRPATRSPDPATRARFATPHPHSPTPGASLTGAHLQPCRSTGPSTSPGTPSPVRTCTTASPRSLPTLHAAGTLHPCLPPLCLGTRSGPVPRPAALLPRIHGLFEAFGTPKENRHFAAANFAAADFLRLPRKMLLRRLPSARNASPRLGSGDPRWLGARDQMGTKGEKDMTSNKTYPNLPTGEEAVRQLQQLEIAAGLYDSLADELANATLSREALVATWHLVADALRGQASTLREAQPKVG